MEIIDDFIIDKGKECWCGILIKEGDWSVWIFEGRPHGYDITFGNKGWAKGKNWYHKVKK